MFEKTFAALALVGLAASPALAQTVAKDAASGPLRAPTADEAKALGAGAAAMRAQPRGLLTGKAAPRPIVHADGSVEQELDESSLVYMVVRRNADGTLAQACVSGPEAAAQALKNGIPKTQEEHPHEEQ